MVMLYVSYGLLKTADENEEEFSAEVSGETSSVAIVWNLLKDLRISTQQSVEVTAETVLASIRQNEGAKKSGFGKSN